MIIYDLKNKTKFDDLNNFVKENVFIIGNKNDMDIISDKYNLNTLRKNKDFYINSNIHFESYADLDYLGLIHYELEENKLIDEKFKLFLNANIIFLLVEKNDGLINDIVEYFFKNIFINFPEEYSINLLYYTFLNFIFHKLFETQELVENKLLEIENQILLNRGNFKLNKIVELKNICFKIKKYSRQFMNIGDQLVLNLNDFFDDNEIRYLHNLDLQINKLYQFSASLYDMTEHLMDLYDSSVNTRTNNLINKLTIFTVFATPISVITGLYGMNFVNMPVLKNPYGYFISLGFMGMSLLIVYIFLKKNKML